MMGLLTRFGGAVEQVSAEETFERDDRRVLVPSLKEQARELTEKLAKERLAARTVQTGKIPPKKVLHPRPPAT